VVNAEVAALVEQLIAEQVEPERALELVSKAPEVCRRQLAYLNYHDDSGERGELLVAAIEGDWPEPARYYWERVSTQSREEDAAPRAAVQAHEQSTDSPPSDDEVNRPPVQPLLEALETIAGMRHAHRSDEACPVCVAWDALKLWEHRVSNE
jgi:hypothetical protein